MTVMVKGDRKEDTGTPDTVRKIVHTCSKRPENVSDVFTCARNGFGGVEKAANSNTGHISVI